MGAVELGTEKVVVLVGEVSGANSLNIIGFGQSQTRGVQKGETWDLSLCSQSLAQAVGAAQESAGVTLQSIILALSGPHVGGFSSQGSVQVSAHSGRVSSEDMQRAIREARCKELPTGRVYVHHIKNGFHLDQRYIENPLGLQGERLQANYWSVFGNEAKLSDQIHMANGLGLKVEQLIVSSVASAALVTTESERHAGVLSVDIGAGTTDYALYQRGCVVRTGVLPVGGDHMVNDLSIALRIPPELARTLYQERARAHQSVPASLEAFSLEGRTFYPESLDLVIEARLRELFALVREAVEVVCPTPRLPGGAVVTGGVSLLPGLGALAAEGLECNVRLGEPPAWVSPALRKPQFSTVLGLMHCALLYAEGLTAQQKSVGLLNRLAGYFHSRR